MSSEVRHFDVTIIKDGGRRLCLNLILKVSYLALELLNFVLESNVVGPELLGNDVVLNQILL